MFMETEQLKWKLEEMLASNNTEWVNTVIMTLNAMYTQFDQERQDLGAFEMFQSQVGLICNRRSQNRTQLRLVR